MRKTESNYIKKLKKAKSILDYYIKKVETYYSTYSKYLAMYNEIKASLHILEDKLKRDKGDDVISIKFFDSTLKQITKLRKSLEVAEMYYLDAYDLYLEMAYYAEQALEEKEAIEEELEKIRSNNNVLDMAGRKNAE